VGAVRSACGETSGRGASGNFRRVGQATFSRRARPRNEQRECHQKLSGKLHDDASLSGGARLRRDRGTDRTACQISTEIDNRSIQIDE
jgi:hypothetical protein